jgi:hypothetical protein
MTTTVDFGAGMEHVKQIVCKGITIINSGYVYGSAETQIVHI